MTDAQAIPDAALAHHIAIIGKTGSGKSNAAKTVVERLLDRDERVCVIDPTGTWWGLRLAGGGKKPSPWPVVIFGGEHADLVIGSNHGAAVAETIGTSSTPAVIDTRLMTVGERTRFFTGFAETLLQKNRGPLHLVIDEAHLFAPQGRVNDPASGQMLHAANNLVSLGRGLGLRIILISQRPAKIHKDSLSQVETLVAMRLVAPQDVAAAKEWIGEWADPSQGREVIASLPSLATGDAWIWAPEIGVLKRDHFPLAITFDSGRPVALGEMPSLAPIDVNAIAGKLETIASEAFANDPGRLKTRVAELEKELRQAKLGSKINPEAVTEVEKRGYERGLADGQSTWLASAAKQIELFGAAMAKTLNEGLLGLAKELEVRPTPRSAPATIPPASNEAKKSDAPAATDFKIPVAAAITKVKSSDGLTGPQLQLLKALAWWKAMAHDQPSRAQLAGIAGWKITSGHLKNVAGSLRAAGLVTYPEDGRLQLTAEGAAAAPAPDLSQSLHDGIRSALNGPQRQIFETLLKHRGGPLDRDVIASELGWELTSGHLKNVVGSMRTLEIVAYPRAGAVALQPWVIA